jgi:hypothetical protein
MYPSHLDTRHVPQQLTIRTVVNRNPERYDVATELRSRRRNSRPASRFGRTRPSRGR